MIDEPLRDFLEQGLSVHLSTRDHGLTPVGARALAIRVHDDRVHVTVYLSAIAAARLVEPLEVSRQAAVNLGRPMDDRACQLKGVFVAMRDATDDERTLVDTQWNGFLGQLEMIGIQRATLAGWSIWPAVAVEIRTTALFEQTPGPLAGTPMP